MDSSQDASREKDSGASNSPHAPPPDRCHLIKRILRAIFRPILWYWGAPAGRTRRLVVAGMLVIAVVATAYLLLPRIDKSLMNTTSVGNPGYDAWIDAVRGIPQGLGTDVVDERVLPVGVMAQVEATMLCEHKGTGVTGGIFCHEPTPRTRSIPETSYSSSQVDGLYSFSYWPPWHNRSNSRLQVAMEMLIPSPQRNCDFLPTSS